MPISNRCSPLDRAPRRAPLVVAPSCERCASTLEHLPMGSSQEHILCTDRYFLDAKNRFASNTVCRLSLIWPRWDSPRRHTCGTGTVAGCDQVLRVFGSVAEAGGRKNFKRCRRTTFQGAPSYVRPAHSKRLPCAVSCASATFNLRPRPRQALRRLCYHTAKILDAE